jgi:alpha-amylase
MIDRYAHDDGSTDPTCELHLFCGGTWKGLENNLDYIQGEQAACFRPVRPGVQ